MTHFESFEDAHMKLGLEGSPKANIIYNKSGILSLKIDESSTYNEVLNGGNIVWYMGFGNKSNGRPIGNQIEKNQQPFFNSRKFGLVFPILRERFGAVYVMGNYCINDIVKKVNPSGFSYYHIKLYKAHDKPFIPRYLKVEL